MEINILPISGSEIDELILLAKKIWLSHYPGIITIDQIQYMLERGYTRDIIEKELDDGVTWLKIVVDGSMVGFASYGPYGARTVKLHKLYLLPDLHGHGIGARALKEVEDLVAGTDAKSLVLNVNKHNDKAIRAYQRAGWQVAEEVCVDIGAGFVMDDYVMEKQLLKS